MVGKIQLQQARKRLADLKLMLGRRVSGGEVALDVVYSDDRITGLLNDTMPAPPPLSALSDPMAEVVDRVQAAKRSLQTTAIEYAESEHRLRNSTAILSLVKRLSDIAAQASAHVSGLRDSLSKLAGQQARVRSFLSERSLVLQRERQALEQQLATIASRFKSLEYEPSRVFHLLPGQEYSETDSPATSSDTAKAVLPSLARLHREHVEAALSAAYYRSEFRARSTAEGTLCARLLSSLLPGATVDVSQAGAVVESQIAAGTNLGAYFLRLKMAGDSAATLLADHTLENLQERLRLVEPAKLEARRTYRDVSLLRSACDSDLTAVQKRLSEIRSLYEGLLRSMGGSSFAFSVTSSSSQDSLAPFSTTLLALRAVSSSLAKAASALGVVVAEDLARSLEGIFSKQELSEIVPAAWGARSGRSTNLGGSVPAVFERKSTDPLALPTSPPSLCFLALYAMSATVDSQELLSFRRNDFLTSIRSLYKPAMSVDALLYRDVLSRFHPAVSQEWPLGAESLDTIYELSRGMQGRETLGHLDQRSPSLFCHTESSVATQLLVSSQLDSASQKSVEKELAKISEIEAEKDLYTEICESLKVLSSSLEGQAQPARSQDSASDRSGKGQYGVLRFPIRQATKSVRSACVAAGLREIGVADSLSVPQECESKGIVPVMKYLDVMRAMSGYLSSVLSVAASRRKVASLRELCGHAGEERARREFLESMLKNTDVRANLSQLLDSAKSLLRRFQEEAPA